MSETRENLKNILRKTADGLDTGNTILSDKEMEYLVEEFRQVTSPYISAYTAMRLSGYQKSEFYKLISEGKLPKGEHVQGFKEIHYNKAKLLKALKKLDSEKKRLAARHL